MHFFALSQLNDPIFLNLPVERSEPNFEQPCSLGLVTMGMVKHLDDMVALDALQIEGVVTDSRRLT